MSGAVLKAPSTDRLDVIGFGETVHDQPSHEDPLDETEPDPPCDDTSVLPAPQRVFCEDDIIGARASVLYEDCLRQLATLVTLSADTCKIVLKTGVMCNCVTPFQIKITSKATAMSVVWVRLDSHGISQLYDRIKMQISCKSQWCTWLMQFLFYLTLRSAQMVTMFGGGIPSPL